MPRAGCGQPQGWLWKDSTFPDLPVFSLCKRKVGANLQLESHPALRPRELCDSPPEAHREARGRWGQARPPAVLPAYLRLRVAGERRLRSAPPAEAPRAGRASGSGSGGSRAPPEAIALPAAEAREPKPPRGQLAGRPPCATARATVGAQAASTNSWLPPRLLRSCSLRAASGLYVTEWAGPWPKADWRDGSARKGSAHNQKYKE